MLYIKLIIGFEFVSEGGFQENPEADVKVTSEQSINILIRQDRFYKAHFQEKYLRLMH